MSAIWIIRPGYQNEYQDTYLTEHRIFLPVPLLEGIDFTDIETYADLRGRIDETFDEARGVKLTQLTDLMAEFVLQMHREDWVLMQLQGTGQLAVGRLASAYGYDPALPPPHRHLREVNWQRKDALMADLSPRFQAAFETQKLLVRVEAPGAEQQLIALAGPRTDPSPEPDSQSKPQSAAPELEAPILAPSIGFDVRPAPRPSAPLDEGTVSSAAIDPSDQVRVRLKASVANGSPDLERDQQTKAASIADGPLEDLVMEILKADGFKVTPIGADHLLAARGKLGLDRPYVLIQLLRPSGQTVEIDAPTLKQLAHAHQSDQRIVVSSTLEFPNDLRQQLSDQGIVAWGRSDLRDHLIALRIP